ncbi:MAG: hypothetical protein M1833_005281 [Piccolia ochrophora]|nr:MAG: hypothetical protein M1833_005281 [Piccolia ochrophora]
MQRRTTGNALRAPKRSKSWGKETKALVYDATNHTVSLEKIAKVNGEIRLERRNFSIQESTHVSADIKPIEIVPVPRWDNRVEIYLSSPVDEMAPKDYFAAVNLDRLGMGVNMQRRLGHIKNLYVV